ncbi:tail fiber-like protein [Synechococcus phage ACG-2014f]|uniref:Tail fiber-like protein n=1 Tax=Synechococcus phage ACG-2014f TaxID=1493511 RepID=A0A0E3FKR8_9CAUD|nr:tail fiber-like protein [Synechococcus phage ACG-2014f]
MANFNKAFNFRGGFQVDEDTFLVRGSNVGIGSSVPSERLDVDGVIKARGLIIDSTDVVAITTAYVGVVSATEVQSGIFTGTPKNGGIATYYGDGSQLINLPTSQWVDIDVGLGFTSIYAAGNVGVDTVDPRYKFQVGGVPFKTKTGPLLQAQDGVGVEDGNIYFSGIASARFKPGLEKQGFVGYGSYINTLNAAELTTGDIPSYAYGDLIITEEIIAPKLTGIASTAIGVTTDAQLSFDTAVANELRAKNRFISTEGYLQIGTDEDVAGVGDIEVVKDTDNSNIYSISNTRAQILVGNERPGGSNRGIGGIRKGTFTSDPLTSATDVDLVNYDVGNLNFYLHNGSGGQGATTGKFRWIYGQRDISVMELDKDGQLVLPDNVVVAGPLLSVGGSAYLKNGAQLDGDLNVTSGIGSFANDVNIFGELSVGSISISGVVTFSGIDTDILTVGSDTVIQSGIATIARIMVVSDTTNSVDIDGSLESSTLVTTNASSSTLVFSQSLTGPNGFTVSSDGSVTASSVDVSGNIGAGGTFEGVDIVTNTGSINDLTVSELIGSKVDVSEVETDSLNVANSSTVNDLSATSIETTSIQADTTDFNAMEATAASVDSLGSKSGSKVDISDDLDLQNNDIDGVNEINVENLNANDRVSSSFGRYGITNNNYVSIDYGDRGFGSQDLPAITFEVFDDNNVSLGQTYFKLYTPVP